MIKKLLSIFVSFIFVFYLSFNNIYALNTLNVSAKAAILIEAKTGKILYSKNENQKLPIASTTKILSTIIALNQQNLNEKFEVDKNAIMVEGSSMGLTVGDKASLLDLSYGMMLPSGNDAANAVAVKVAGSIPKFANIMNDYAKKIGMTNSNFVTPSGLHHDDHYSTAYDMALLMRFAMKNAQFREITSKYTANVSFGNPPYSRTLQNHNKLLKQYKSVIGGKTGFTDAAGRCLVSVAEKDGLMLIAVTLNASQDWNDHANMYDYGFENLKPLHIQNDIGNLKIKITGGNQDELNVSSPDNVKAYITEEEKLKLKKQILLKPFYYAPINKGDTVGEIQYIIDDTVVAIAPLLAEDSVEQKIVELKEDNLLNKIVGFFSNLIENIKSLFN